MTYKSLVIILVIACLAGCATPKTQPVARPQQTIDWAHETPESILKRIDIAAQNIKILSAFFNLSMAPPPQRMMSSMSGVITIDSRTKPPKVRIQAFHLFGSTLFDMVNTTVTKIYVPRKNTMYIGTSEEKKTRGPQTIFANMMLDPTNLLVAEQSKLEIKPETIILHLHNGWLKLDKQTGLITTRQKDDLLITYADYTRVGAGHLIPTTITIETSDGQFSATCHLSNMATPATLPDAFFDLSEYKPQAIKTLDELH